ncbi:copper transporter [Schnuerera sp. xch1]|uniref:copper transporter n=1 Tax=Schnuerera sp. xch1 TaxID=2874283 RepID=UPI001CBD2655|nr:copper transporter [Schnuerera sp. xch1]MBZ2173765.1 copper transporter [Schnuerera sp. xch1]
MIPNMKFYVISIVALFAALGIGIYIGFTLDAQNLIDEQKESIVDEIEKRFDFLSKENNELKQSLDEVEAENDNYKYFIDSTYQETIKNKLLDTKVAIIETKSDYMYSGIGQVLDMSGADVVNVTTISDKFLNKDLLMELYNKLNIQVPKDNLTENTIIKLTEAIIKGEPTALVTKLIDDEFIDLVGLVNEDIDYIIIAGGSTTEEEERINLIDKTIVNISKDMSVPIIGVEKSRSNYSYMEAYKELGISTVDNIDTTIGKVSLILAMEGRPGHYGTSQTAEQLIPKLNLPLVEYFEESE